VTREEAIEVLGKMKYPQKVNKNGFIISNVNIENEALEMAIKALSQEPCDRIEYGTDGNAYKLWMSNGKEFEQEPTVTSTDEPMTMVYPTIVCDDAISREAVLDLFYDLDNLYERIKALPPVIPKIGEDAISRETVIQLFGRNEMLSFDEAWILRKVKELPSITPSRQWIPVSEKLPKDTYPVNITWVNHDPESYYANIKDKPFTATGCYCDGKWYWYSVTCQDYLDEYRYCDVDSMDEAIEVIAWMPLPKPYEPKESEDKG